MEMKEVLKGIRTITLGGKTCYEHDDIIDFKGCGPVAFDDRDRLIAELVKWHTKHTSSSSQNSVLRDNILLDTDSYKLSHWTQYPPKTTYMFSYLTSRGGKYGQTVVVGLQPILKRLEKGFTLEDIDEAAAFAALHGEPFNKEGFTKMYHKYNGKFPVRIRSVAEGTVVPTNQVIMTMESTDEEFFWIVSYLETSFLRVWYPITVATQSWTIKQIIASYLEKTSDDPEGEILYKLHDFGSRGVSSRESAMIGGFAHLVNFRGSDTLVGIRFANQYYKCKMAGSSIPAAEHSTMTMWGGREGEAAAMSNMIDQYGKSMFACVSDSYDIDNATANIWGGSLKNKVVNAGGMLVIRPDSGDPLEVLPRLFKIADEKFGFYFNKKGYKVFNNVRFIWGDGINEDTIRAILKLLTENGYSATNIAFGMGGALLQQVHRDTLKFAIKCSFAMVDGKGVDVYKDPITDKGKASLRGKLDLVKVYNGEKVSYKTVAGIDNISSALHVVFDKGVVTKEYTMDEVRKNAST